MKTTGLNGLAAPGLLVSATAPVELPPNTREPLEAAVAPVAPNVNCPEDAAPVGTTAGAPVDTTGAPNSGAGLAAVFDAGAPNNGWVPAAAAAAVVGASLLCPKNPEEEPPVREAALDAAAVAISPNSGAEAPAEAETEAAGAPNRGVVACGAAAEGVVEPNEGIARFADGSSSS